METQKSCSLNLSYKEIFPSFVVYTCYVRALQAAETWDACLGCKADPKDRFLHFKIRQHDDYSKAMKPQYSCKSRNIISSNLLLSLVPPSTVHENPQLNLNAHLYQNLDR